MFKVYVQIAIENCISVKHSISSILIYIELITSK